MGTNASRGRCRQVSLSTWLGCRLGSCRPRSEAADGDARLDRQHRSRHDREAAQQLPSVGWQALCNQRVVRVCQVHLLQRADGDQPTLMIQLWLQVDATYRSRLTAASATQQGHAQRRR